MKNIEAIFFELSSLMINDIDYSKGVLRFVPPFVNIPLIFFLSFILLSFVVFVKWDMT